MKHNKQNRQNVRGEKHNEGKKETQSADMGEGVVWKEATMAEFAPDCSYGNLSLTDRYGQTEVGFIGEWPMCVCGKVIRREWH